MCVSLSTDSGELLHLGFLASALVAPLKAHIGKPDPNRAAPMGRLRALGNTQVSIEAVLGQTTLAVEELEGLAVGDVVVLDRLANAEVELRIMCAGQLLARGTLERRDGRVAVQL